LPHASLTPAGEERCAADFIALLGMLAEAFPRAPVIVVICDNDSIHHARKVTAYLKEHPRLGLLYGARYSPDNNPAERIWAALKNYVANTAVSWPSRPRQIHAFCRSRSPDKMLATAAPWTSPWLPLGYEQNFWNAALAEALGIDEPEAILGVETKLPNSSTDGNGGPSQSKQHVGAQQGLHLIASGRDESFAWAE
jgi:DDE superfamily endonuclease